jgi:hypothetical protein
LVLVQLFTLCIFVVRNRNRRKWCSSRTRRSTSNTNDINSIILPTTSNTNDINSIILPTIELSQARLLGAGLKKNGDSEELKFKEFKPTGSKEIRRALSEEKVTRTGLPPDVYALKEKRDHENWE